MNLPTSYHNTTPIWTPFELIQSAFNLSRSVCKMTSSTNAAYELRQMEDEVRLQPVIDFLDLQLPDIVYDDHFDGDFLPWLEPVDSILGEPPVQYFAFLEDVERFLNSWTCKRGYGLRTRTSPKDIDGEVKARYYVCDKAPSRSTYEPKGLRDKPSIAGTCKFKCNVSRNDESIWVVRTTYGTHDHRPSVGEFQHPGLRRRLRRDGFMKELREAFFAGDSVQNVLNRFQHKVPIIYKDVVNERASHKTDQLQGRSPLQALFYGLQDEFILYSDHEAYDFRLSKLLFFHKESLKLWATNSDVILMDATYKTNRFNMPLVNLVGATANNETFFIAAAFVSTEGKEDYKWILQRLAWLYDKMGLSPPRVFITDNDGVMAVAITAIFPRSAHLLCI
jgi:hypothetical protein